jgi:hypothetical protein
MSTVGTTTIPAPPTPRDSVAYERVASPGRNSAARPRLKLGPPDSAASTIKIGMTAKKRKNTEARFRGSSG